MHFLAFHAFHYFLTSILQSQQKKPKSNELSQNKPTSSNLEILILKISPRHLFCFYIQSLFYLQPILLYYYLMSALPSLFKKKLNQITVLFARCRLKQRAVNSPLPPFPPILDCSSVISDFVRTDNPVSSLINGSANSKKGASCPYFSAVFPRIRAYLNLIVLELCIQ